MYVVIIADHAVIRCSRSVTVLIFSVWLVVLYYFQLYELILINNKNKRKHLRAFFKLTKIIKIYKKLC